MFRLKHLALFVALATLTLFLVTALPTPTQAASSALESSFITSDFHTMLFSADAIRRAPR
ncbi:MAG TPA: hypothetical protein VFD70_06850 [Anaerolineae bacterium]|nr:hypothetical protein [Anaerolineae bacterium]